MKKILFIAIVAVASLASCKKDRVCTCTDTSSASGSTASTYVITYTKSSKKTAKANCLSTTTVSDGVTYTSNCELK